MSDYKALNKLNWNKRTPIHLESKFYNQEEFLKGKSSLKEPELSFLPKSLKKQSLLHLQCHFGQDSLSLAKMGAKVTGVDLSDLSIKTAKELALQMKLDAEFICSDIFDFSNETNKSYDWVFTSYGTVIWLPNLKKWASLIQKALKPGGHFLMVDLHPFVWTFDPNMERIAYDYFNGDLIHDVEEKSYTDGRSKEKIESITWNHGLAEIIQALLDEGLMLKKMEEFDYSPYDCLSNLEEQEPGKFRFNHIKNRIPMLHAQLWQKSF